ncbi:MAG TPA: polyprenol monophosphomannose synthase [Terriglobales bacterium]|nr:polyprenol monophosphomannose synthase [Terriglobales bacterium]
MGSAKAVLGQPESSVEGANRRAAFEESAPAKLAVVVPTLCEAANITSALERAMRSLDTLGISYELIVVDDDSRDGIEFLVNKLAAENNHVRFLCRQGERGLGGAVIYGWQHSTAEVLGVMDADLQHPPELLPELWKAVESGSDIALASRYIRPGSLERWHFLRHWLSRAAIALTWPLQRRGIAVKDPMSGFFLVRRSCIQNLGLQTKGFKLLLEILVRGDVHSVDEVPFTFGLRQAGSSKAGFRVGLDYLLMLGRLWKQHRRDRVSAPKSASVALGSRGGH